ncbi:tautomerase family protein [Actinomycetospora endophytica]|uniref:Tautomerase family protein n=1 Tax=Actinomycetospora endophytica TaxID=2291215 RepID=A0ABS8PH67_9PSEU|nr:tautomerase family protein [Actinomycetospora endophytica]MCD2197590.1 tautomerase family protein [Actinomycetospora endophytica]
MPNYAIHLRTESSTAAARADLARRISAVHARATAAPPSFVQVIVHPIVGEHFIAGEPVDPRAVFVHGHIRAGRTAEAKHELIVGLRDAVVAALGVPDDLVWVYVSEIPAEQMVEFGRVLPAPGQEAEWQAALPDDVRDRLARLDAGIS